DPRPDSGPVLTDLHRCQGVGIRAVYEAQALPPIPPINPFNGLQKKPDSSSTKLKLKLKLKLPPACPIAQPPITAPCCAAVQRPPGSNTAQRSCHITRARQGPLATPRAPLLGPDSLLAPRSRISDPQSRHFQQHEG
ncbi:hypothetical protein V490_09020, partial [Pseudogymnoascus sp. VKM F-3557]